MTRLALAVGVILAAIPQPSVAQGRDPRRDAVYRAMVDFPSLVGGGAVQPHWLADGNRFRYPDSAPDRTVIRAVDPVRNAVTPLFDAARVRRSVAAALGHEPPYHGFAVLDVRI